MSEVDVTRIVITENISAGSVQPTGGLDQVRPRACVMSLYAAIRFLRLANHATPAKPLAKRGRAAGSGTALTVAMGTTRTDKPRLSCL